jgi:hypothetical protein
MSVLEVPGCYSLVFMACWMGMYAAAWEDDHTSPALVVANRL